MKHYISVRGEEKRKCKAENQLKGQCSKTRDLGRKKASSTRAAGLDDNINSGDESDGINAWRHGKSQWQCAVVLGMQVCNISMSQQ